MWWSLWWGYVERTSNVGMASVVQTQGLATCVAKRIFLHYFKLLELPNWHTDVPDLYHFSCLKWLIPTVGKGRTGLEKNSFHFQITHAEISSFPEAFPPVLWLLEGQRENRGLRPCKMSDVARSMAQSGQPRPPKCLKPTTIAPRFKRQTSKQKPRDHWSPPALKLCLLWKWYQKVLRLL